MGGFLKAASVVARVVGVVGRKADGQPVKARGARLLVTATALLVALFSHFGLPPELAQPLADFLVEVGVTATQ